MSVHRQCGSVSKRESAEAVEAAEVGVEATAVMAAMAEAAMAEERIAGREAARLRFELHDVKHAPVMGDPGGLSAVLEEAATTFQVALNIDSTWPAQEERLWPSLRSILSQVHTRTASATCNVMVH